MANKRALIILGFLALVVIAFVYRSVTSEGDPMQTAGPGAYFPSQGNVFVPFGQPLVHQIKVRPQQQKVSLYINDSLVFEKIKPSGILSINLPLKGFSLGSYRLRVVSIGADGLTSEDERVLFVVSDLQPENWSIEVVNRYPHNDSSFTQGLSFFNGKLFEGTGDPQSLGASMVAEVAFTTGKILRRRIKPTPIFGEGITVFEGELFQITWKNDSCFVYNAASLMPLRSYTYSGEGWGLTHDSRSLIMSDGSEKIYFRNPKTFAVDKTLSVFTHQGPVNYLNELEYIDGLLYANIWMSNLLAVIDPSTGRVMATIDATNIVKEGRGNGEVLNGIAYNSQTKKIYITGKYWPSLFEIKIRKPKES